MVQKPEVDHVFVADALHSAAIHLLRRVRAEDDASGLSAPRLSALSVIVFGGPLPMTELARAEQVSPPTISRLVRDLEGAGLVRITADPNDGRVRRVGATDSGRKLLQEGRRRRVGALAEDLAGLSQRDRRTLARAAGILTTLVRPTPSPGDGGAPGSVEPISRSPDPGSSAPPVPDR